MRPRRDGLERSWNWEDWVGAATDGWDGMEQDGSPTDLAGRRHAHKRNAQRRKAAKRPPGPDCPIAAGGHHTVVDSGGCLHCGALVPLPQA